MDGFVDTAAAMLTRSRHASRYVKGTSHRFVVIINPFLSHCLVRNTQSGFRRNRPERRAQTAASACLRKGMLASAAARDCLALRIVLDDFGRLRVVRAPWRDRASVGRQNRMGENNDRAGSVENDITSNKSGSYAGGGVTRDRASVGRQNRMGGNNDRIGLVENDIKSYKSGSYGGGVNWYSRCAE